MIIQNALKIYALKVKPPKTATVESIYASWSFW